MTDLIARAAGPWTWGQLGIAFLFILGGIVLRAMVNVVIKGRLRNLASRTESRADDKLVDALISPTSLVLPVVGLYLALRILLSVRVEWRDNADMVFKVLTVLLLTWTVFRIIDALAVFLRELTSKTESRLDDQVVPLLR